jgi:hypothetical protein
MKILRIAEQNIHPSCEFFEPKGNGGDMRTRCIRLKEERHMSERTEDFWADTGLENPHARKREATDITQL